jgi:DUF4097 and DUF4098 domain-containing protein YvlB
VEYGGKLHLNTDIGSVEVYGTRSSMVEVEVIRKLKTTSSKRGSDLLRRFDLDFDHRGDDVYITGDYHKEGLRGLWDSISNRLRVKFIVHVPFEYDVDLRTSGGSISIEDLEGEVVSKTSGGSLSFASIKGYVYGRTSGGGIRIDDVIGDVDVHTSGGSIRANFIDGDVKADTSGGGITIEEVRGSVVAHTSGGSVKATFTDQPRHDCKLTTSGGSITVYIESGIGFFVDAHTSGGGIYNDFPVMISGRIDKKSLKADINRGGPELYLRTSGGSIHIRKR